VVRGDGIDAALNRFVKNSKRSLELTGPEDESVAIFTKAGDSLPERHRNLQVQQ
jgi:hypothetical protein